MLQAVITGCGRSGTGYMASLLTENGHACGHEDIYTAFGVRRETGMLVADSSWFAVPHVSSMPKDTKIIHIVRNPRLVFNSFSRLGMFSDSVWRHFTRGMPLHSFLLKFHVNIPRYRRRLDYVRACQQAVRQNTTCFERSDEAERIWQYWLQWNRLLEANVVASRCPYLRVRLEDIDAMLPAIADFTGLSLAASDSIKRNEKAAYSARHLAMREMPADVRQLALSYGYTAEDLG
jgi:hypothetical protein